MVRLCGAIPLAIADCAPKYTEFLTFQVLGKMSKAWMVG